MKLSKFLTESERRSQFLATGDAFDVVINEELALEFDVVYHNKDMALVEADEVALELLEHCGCTFEEDLDEAKAKTNFDVEDLYRLQNINDLEKLKKQAFVLISKPSEKPMKPEKVSWFERSLEKMNSKDSVMKMMWDLFMSGEGLAVQGSRYSTDKNYYRKAFGEELDEAKYRGREVKLNKPMRGDVKKYKVYVKHPKTGNVVKVNFGSKEMEIKRDDPARRKSFRARHKCADKTAAKDRHTAGYWSCRLWSSKPVSDILKGK